MNGAIPPLPNMPSWRGSQLKKHRDNFAAHAASYPMGDMGSFPGGKAAGA